VNDPEIHDDLSRVDAYVRARQRIEFLGAVDHLIPLCLGGADDDASLWPEPRRSIEPQWNAERKDELEARACALVCTNAIDVHEAQEAIAEDWIAAYQRHVGAK
jgi:hypothetical protein